MNHSRRAVDVAVLLLLAVIIAPPLCAAEKSDWTSLKGVARAQKVKVTLTNGKSLQGDFQSVSDNALVIHLASGDQTFSREEVRRLAIKRNGHRGKHTLIGAAIGAGAGLGAGIAVDQCSPTVIVCTGNKGKAIITPTFALIGAGIGALLPANAWQEIYHQ
jgi:hypothetical protein